MQWVCDHLGHSLKVHQQYYKQLSGYIERVKVAKLLLIEDLGLTVTGKELDDSAVDGEHFGLGHRSR